MSKTDAGTCAACRYWSKFDKRGSVEHEFWIGNCRRSPPIRCTQLDEPFAETQECVGDVLDDYGWPVTVEDDWCGKWERRPGT